MMDPTSPPPIDGANVLEVRGLTTEIATRQGVVRPVDDVCLSLRAGEVLGLVGESGCGKSMTAYSIIGLVDPPARIVAGSVRLRGQELVGADEETLRRVRGNRVAMIFQDPMMTLNPVLRIDTQMIEAVQAHRPMPREQARRLCREALERVGIASAEQRLRSYPHQFSGGMRQRVAIAIALLNQPDLIICDEPTTALDVTIQSQILHEMQALCEAMGTALLWITHDLSVVAGLADRMCVMYAGRVVELGATSEVLSQPRHPYTRALLASAPARHARGQILNQIGGQPPSLARLPPGCAFAPRCERAGPDCAQMPALRALDEGEVRCHRPVEKAEAPASGWEAA
jgi:peptide/nickel transport system ATP-binding protein